MALHDLPGCHNPTKSEVQSQTITPQGLDTLMLLDDATRGAPGKQLLRRAVDRYSRKESDGAREGRDVDERRSARAASVAASV